MNILHITAYYFTITRGGTETYINGLTMALDSLQHNNSIVVLNDLEPAENMKNVFHVDTKLNDSVIKEQLDKIIKKINPDQIFIHSSDTKEYLAGEVSREYCIPYIYFFHAPYWLCYQKNLKFLYKTDCKKMFSPFRCAVCTSSGGNLFIGIKKTVVCEILRWFKLKKVSSWNCYRTELKQKKDLITRAERIIVFTEKDRELFIENSILPGKIGYIPQELEESRLKACLQQNIKERCGIPHFGYIGRCCEIKGCKILVEAALKIPKEIAFQLDIYGCNWNDPYCRKLKEISENDSRIRLFEMIPSDEIPEKLGAFDVLCIPSIVFETGPFTLREGVYSGCYVIGSDQIGQMDFLLKYGHLIKENTPEAWTSEFLNCIRNMKEIRAKKKNYFSAPKSMNSAAKEILDLIKK